MNPTDRWVKRQVTEQVAAALSKKNKLPPKLLPIHGQNKYMPDFRAREYERRGLAVIYNGTVHFYDSASDAGYNSGPDIVKWAARKSGYAGPDVLQAIRG